MTEWKKAETFQQDQRPSTFNLGLWKQQAGDYEGAISQYTRAINEGSDNAVTFHSRGVCRLMTKNLSGALGDFTRAIERDPQHEGAWRDRGYVNDEMGDHEAALADCSRALQLDPRDSLAYQYRSAARQALGDWKGALDDCTARIRLNPNDGFVYCNRGIARLAMDDRPGALEDFSHAIDLEPLNPAGYEHRAHLNYNRHEWSPALEDFRRMVELNQSNADYARFRIWLIRCRMGERQDADRELREAFRIRFSIERSVWEVQIASYLTGARSEEEFLKAAEASDPSVKPGRICGATFYVGSKHLIENDTEGSRVQFQRCLDGGEKRYREFASAAAELRQLKK